MGPRPKFAHPRATLGQRFSVDIPGGIPCAEDGSCPAGQTCELDGKCYNEGEGPDEGFCSAEVECEDPERPFCDIDGSFGGAANACIATPQPCEPSETVCVNDTVFECDASGAVASTTACDLGCHDTEARCFKLDPANGMAPFLDSAETGPAVVLSDGAIINTTNGQITNGDGNLVAVTNTLLPAPNGGVAVRVFEFGSLIVGNATVTGLHGAAIVVDGSIEIRGDLVVAPGTGAMNGTICDPPAPPPVVSGANPGAGGGGFGSAGSNGGNGNGGLGLFGVAENGSASLVPLRGGCHGRVYGFFVQGSFCTDGLPLPKFPLGGGALHLVAGSVLTLGPAGFSASIGAQGSGGDSGGSCLTPGLGGGSGGAILLEAPTVRILDGTVTAHGAGGACEGKTGGDGSASGDPNNATCASTADGDGGVGATRFRASQKGQNGIGAATGGGGGGGAGRIRISTATGSISDTAVSPAPFQSPAGRR